MHSAEESLKTLKSNLTICVYQSSAFCPGGGHLCLGLSEGGCRAAIRMKNGRTAAGPQEATLPAFHILQGSLGHKGRVPRMASGVPQGTGLFRRRLNGGQRGDRPRLSMGCTEVCSPVVCGQTPTGQLVRSRGGVGEAGKVGIASQPPRSKRSTAGHRAMHVGIACA